MNGVNGSIPYNAKLKRIVYQECLDEYIWYDYTDMAIEVSFAKQLRN